MDNSFGLGNFMDGVTPPMKPQSTLRLEDLYRRGGEDEAKKKYRLQQLLQQLQQQYPNRSPMANYMQAYGMLQQEDISGFKFDNAFQKSQKDMGMTY